MSLQQRLHVANVVTLQRRSAELGVLHREVIDVHDYFRNGLHQNYPGHNTEHIARQISRIISSLSTSPRLARERNHRRNHLISELRVLKENTRRGLYGLGILGAGLGVHGPYLPPWYPVNIDDLHPDFGRGLPRYEIVEDYGPYGVFDGYVGDYGDVYTQGHFIDPFTPWARQGLHFDERRAIAAG
ncbi:MAG: hypothetical protein M1814_001043 [Vezdaea aestivalis]|nr:MAG: hypothetical protein M1814_001043 [Vezdaea aestivalis]